MVREEQRRYDEARALANVHSPIRPGCAPAAHVITHVNYETGEHEAGIAWFDEWSRDRDFLGRSSAHQSRKFVELLASRGL
jgi:hypothetical protein